MTPVFLAPNASRWLTPRAVKSGSTPGKSSTISAARKGTGETMGTTLILAIVNLLLVMLVAPFSEGVMRKLKALVHSRKGPPLTQPYLDLLKLLGKEDLQVTGNPLFSLGPVMTFAGILVAALFTPMGTAPPLGFAGDLIVLVYFLALASVGVMLGGTSTGSPYGTLGVAREMMLAM